MNNGSTFLILAEKGFEIIFESTFNNDIVFNETFIFIFLFS